MVRIPKLRDCIAASCRQSAYHRAAGAGPVTSIGAHPQISGSCGVSVRSMKGMKIVKDMKGLARRVNVAAACGGAAVCG